MNLRVFKTLVSAVVVLAVLFVSASCSGGSLNQPGAQVSAGSAPAINGKSPSNGTLQKNNEGAVAVAAQWMGEQNGLIVFGISMDTHSVDLDQYNLSLLAVLRDDSGNEYTPVSWNAAPGGHHREGRLAFPIPDSLTQGQTKFIKIIIKGIDNINERVFEWDL